MIYLIIIFLSIVLECFPISSSGNLYFFSKIIEYFFGLSLDHTLLGYLDYISHGAIALTLALFFYKDWAIFIKRFFKAIPLLAKLFLAGFITELITVLCWLASSRITPSWILLSIGFFCTTFLLVSLSFCQKSKNVTYNPKNAWIFGLAQGIALLPGISRFGSTFVVARWLGFSSRKSFQLSFLISWPVNVAAFCLGIYKLYEHQLLDLLNLKLLLVMLIGSSIALLCLHMVNKIINNHKLWLFSMYTGALAIISLFMSY